MTRPSLLYLAEGSSETPQSWSGSSLGVVRALRALGAQVHTSDVLPGRLGRWLSIAASFHPDRKTWSARYHSGAVGELLRRSRARRAVRRHAEATAVVQNGATFDSAIPDRPLFIYCDANAIFAARGRPYSSVAALSETTLQRVIERERRVYQRATAVFTLSDALRRSFIEDFGVPPERVRTAHGGSNLPYTPGDDVLSAARSGPPTILFVGKDFERKGGLDLLAAFREMRCQLPDARLVIAGANPPQAAGVDGVEIVGYVDPTRTGPGSLSALYASADLFCMPSRYEPFGVVFVEAMLHGLPCVGARAWAMPEIIAENETGWLSPPGDVRAVAATLTAALADRQRLRAFGARGRQRALTHFTWTRAAEIILAGIREFSAAA